MNVSGTLNTFFSFNWRNLQMPDSWVSYLFLMRQTAPF